MRLDLVHRTLVGVDVEKYGPRDNQDHYELRKALREVLADACEAVRVSPSEVQDQGDAYLSLFGPEVPKPTLVDGLVREIDNGLRRYNRDRVAGSHLRVRVAIHSGELHIDGRGYPGRVTVAAARLLDAQPAKQALASSTGNLVVIVSQRIYEDVVVHGYGAIIPAQYDQVQVANKEFAGTAWIRLPGEDGPRQDGLDQPVDPGPREAPTDAGGPDAGSRSAAPPGSWDLREAFGNAHFAGPTSFGGHAAGRDVRIEGDSDGRRTR